MPAVKLEDSEYSLSVDIHNSQTYFTVYLEDCSGQIKGSIEAEQDNNIFFVTYVSAPHGYGPMLYDRAIQIACELADGLSPGHVVSEEASKVWWYYLNNRDDIKKSPLLELSKGDFFSREKKWKKLGFKGGNAFLQSYSK